MRRSGTLPALHQPSTVAKHRVAKANYGFLKEKIVGLTPHRLHCRLFCRGPNCKYCSLHFPWGDEDQAFGGLYSHWITNKICAMARPTQVLIKSADLMTQFHENGIRSIVNLQKPGEHQECSPNPLGSEGFSYSPEVFMENKVFYYNFGWPDFGVASLSLLLDMVKVVSFATKEGAVAIHCHAGLGRTGVLIAAFLIWERELTAGEAIAYLRLKRRNSVQTRDQVTIVYRFEEMLRPLIRVFPPLRHLTYQEVLAQQTWLLHGLESRTLKYLPKIVFVICERLFELAGLNASGTLAKKLHQLSFGDELFYQHILEHNLHESIGTAQVSMKRGALQRATSLVNILYSSLGPPPLSPGKLPPLENDSDNNTATWSLAETSLASESPPNLLPPICACDYDDNGTKIAIDWARLMLSCRLDLKSDLEESTVFGTVGYYVRSLKHKKSSWDQICLERNPDALILTLQTWFLSIKKPPLDKYRFPLLGTYGQMDDGNCKLNEYERVLLDYLCRAFALFSGNQSGLVEESAGLLAEWLFRSREDSVVSFLRPLLIHSIEEDAVDSSTA